MVKQGLGLTKETSLRMIFIDYSKRAKVNSESSKVLNDNSMIYCFRSFVLSTILIVELLNRVIERLVNTKFHQGAYRYMDLFVGHVKACAVSTQH